MQSRRLRVATIAAFALVFLGAASPPAAAQPVVMVSGNGTPCTTDPLNQMRFSTNGGTTFTDWAQAHIVTPHPAWAQPLGTSQWISINCALGPPVIPSTVLTNPVLIQYRRTFELPADCQAGSLSLRAFADNSASILLNGVPFGFSGEFLEPPDGPFVVPVTQRQNVLEFHVQEFGVVTGLDYEAILTCVEVAADVVVTKGELSPDPQPGNQNIRYTISIQNNGPGVAENVTLTDAIPAGTTFVSLEQFGSPVFTCTTPPPGGTGTVTCTRTMGVPGANAFHLTVAVNPGFSGTITNTVTATSTTPDPNQANNTDTETTLIDRTPPSCVVTIGANVIQARVQDAQSGIVSIERLVAENVTVTGAPATFPQPPPGQIFPPGTPGQGLGDTDEKLVTAVRISRRLPMRLQIRVTNAAGLQTTCDPALQTLRIARTGKASQTFRGIERTWHKVTVKALKPGLTRAVVVANGHRFTLRLKGKRQASLSIRPALLHQGKNTVRVSVFGKAGARALVALTD